MDAIDVKRELQQLTCRRCRREFEVTTAVGPLTGKRIVVERPFCDDCEAELREEEAAEVKRQEEEAFRRRCAKCLEELAAPAQFAQVSVNGMNAHWGSKAQQERVGRALVWARRLVGELSQGLSPAPFLAFSGRPGTGKTMLVYAIANDLAGQYGKRARVVRLSAMIRDLREAWRGSGASEAARLRRYTEVDFLGIDEVSRDGFYGQPRQHLLDVINDRVDNRRPTVITTNENRDGLEEILGPALMSRLALGGIVSFGFDEDYRQLPANERGAA